MRDPASEMRSSLIHFVRGADVLRIRSIKGTTMATPERSEDVPVMDERFRRALSSGLRIVGGIVILATAAIALVGGLWLFAPELLTESRRTEGLTICVLVTSLVVSSTGGLFMSAMTKDPSWLLALFFAGGTVALWLLIAGAMGPVMH